MKSFLLVIVAILFIACSSDPVDGPPNESTNERTRARVATTPDLDDDNDLGPADSDLAPVSAEEDTTNDLAASGDNATPTAVETTDPKQELIALDDVSADTPPADSEELVPLDSTEDQFLVTKIKKRYDDYVMLQDAWEDHAPAFEILMDQATNQEFLNTVHFIQSHMEDVPVTFSQITEIEEKLQEQEGTFNYEEDRNHAESTYEQLDAFVTLFEASLYLSLEYVEAAEEDPSVLYAEQTTGDAEEGEERSEFIPENNVTADTSGIESIATIQKKPESLTQPWPTPSDIPPEDIIVDAETEKDCDNDLNMVCSTGTSEDSAIADASTDKTETPSKTTSEDTHTDKDADPVDEDSDIAEETTDASTEDAVATANNEASSKEEETSLMEDVVAWWDGVVQWADETFSVSSLSRWVVEPTSLHIPNTSNIVPEEEEETEQKTEDEEKELSHSSNEARQLINGFMQDVNQYAQIHGIQNAEDLSYHLQIISIMPETERTAEESALLSKTKQVVQSMDQMTDGSASDFVAFSGYTSNELPQTEVVMIVDMLSNALKTAKEAPQEETGTES